MLKAASFVIIILLFIACEEEEPVPNEQLVKVYVDLLIAQDTISNPEISVDSLRHLILPKYNLNDSLYKEAIDYLSAEPKRWEEFLNSANKYIENLQKKETDKNP